MALTFTPEQCAVIANDVKVHLSYYEDNLYRLRLLVEGDDLARTIKHHEDQVAQRKAILSQIAGGARIASRDEILDALERSKS